LDSLSSLLIPFRNPAPGPRLPEGYQFESDGELPWEALNHLLTVCGETQRSQERWHRVLACSAWHLAIRDPSGRLVGFIRATSDQALNANLWDLLTDPADPGRNPVITALVQMALARLRRELSGCSISLSAPPEALQALKQVGFVVDPGGIRAMGLCLESN
jgi:hypothetical protein